MRHRLLHRLVRVLAGLVAVLTLTGTAPVSWAASHREAPLIALDPAADITDVYAFRSWEDDSKAVFIMNVIPQQVPMSGPNFYNLDDLVLYTFHFDLNQDGKAEDLDIQFRFKTEIRNNASPATPLANFQDLPVAYAAVGPITALDGPGSEGLGLRQRYTVRAIARSPAGQAVATAIGTQSTDASGHPLIAVPSNVGPETIPDYKSLAEQGIYNLGHGIRVFVGQRSETFYIDLGSTFDTLNFRLKPPILTLAQDLDDTQNAFGINDGFEGLNVTTIAIEIPRALLPSTVGLYASTSRQRNRHVQNDGTSVGAGTFVQVQRLANPLVNEVIIGTGSKDFWNSQDPASEAQFLGFYTAPRLAAILNALFGTSFPTANRTDIVTVLLTYFPPIFSGPPGVLSDLLRVNLDIPATPPANQRRLTVLGSVDDGHGGCNSLFPASQPDLAGWPNGRRPNDDVTDIAVRVVAGVLLGPVPCLGDGVNFVRVRPEIVTLDNLNPGNNISTAFPFLPTPNPGRSGGAPFTTGPNEPLFR